MKVIGIVTVLLLCVVHTSAQCTFNAGVPYLATYANTCLRALPFNETTRQQTLDTLYKSIPIFTFYEIAANPPASKLSLTPTDLWEGLNQIAKKQYQTDIDFQNDITYLYNQLNDAHSLYFRPNNYASLSYYQPFSLSSFVDNDGQQHIFNPPYSLPGLVNIYSSFNIDITQYYNATVLTINGEDAVEHMINFAKNSVGLSKDLGTRYNVALTRFIPTPPTISFHVGAFQKRRGIYGVFPQETEITYTLLLSNGTVAEVSMPWVVISAKDYANMDAWYADWLYPEPRFFQSEPPKTQEQITEMLIHDPQPVKIESTHTNNLYANNDKYTLLTNFKEEVYFYALDDKKTLVMFLSTFAPNPQTFPQFAATVIKGFNLGQQQGLTNLVLDFTDNGGGFICLGIALVRLLFGGSYNDDGFGPTDMPLSQLAELMTTTAAQLNNEDTIWSASSYASYPKNVDWNNNDTTWLIPGISYTRGGKQRRYSQLLHLAEKQCEGFFTFKPLANPFPPQNIAIITHGFCGSTCALFTVHAHLWENVKTIVGGGFANTPQQFMSFPGLQVVGHTDYTAMFQVLGRQTDTLSAEQLAAQTSKLSYQQFYNQGFYTRLDDREYDVIPRKFPTSAGYRYCIREIYPLHDIGGTPTEYSFLAADYRFTNTMESAIAPYLLWDQAASMLPFAA